MVFQIDYKEISFKTENVVDEFIKELGRYGSVLESEEDTTMDKYYRKSGTVFLAFGGNNYSDVFESLHLKFENDIIFRAARITEMLSIGYDKVEEWISNYIVPKC